MKLLVTAEDHYFSDGEGRIFTANPPNYQFFSRFLNVFDSVVVLARVRPSASSFPLHQRADGPGVAFVGLPDFEGARGLLGVMPRAHAIANAAVRDCDSVLIRVPGVVAALGLAAAAKQHKIYGVQVLGDPLEVFSERANSSPLRILFRAFFVSQVRNACRDAVSIAYVSDAMLPKRYPPNPDASCFIFSDVRLDGALLSDAELQERVGGLRHIKPPFQIGTIAALQKPYKGIDVLLHALAVCKGRLDFRLTVVGDGVLRLELETLAKRLNIADRVHFAGQLSSGKEIFEFLDQIHLYVQPSRTEGLPRAVIEAMARGCPVIASRVGGIPELLEDPCLVPPNIVGALAEKILRFHGDVEILAHMAQVNAVNARRFDEVHLAGMRTGFLSALRNVISRRTVAESA